MLAEAEHLVFSKNACNFDSQAIKIRKHQFLPNQKTMKNNGIPLLPGKVYHIYNHANGFEKLFCNEGNYLYFLKKYIKYIAPIADTFSFCLMPNHIHLVVRIKAEHDLPGSFKLPGRSCSAKLSQQFGNLFSSYAQAFNKQQRRMGSLFIPNFKRKLVEDKSYFGNLIPYVHLNPVEAGLVMHPADWPYSSFSSLIADRPSRLLRTEVLAFFGGRVGFLQAHKITTDECFLEAVDHWP